MTRIHLYGPDILRMIKAIETGTKQEPFGTADENEAYREALAGILTALQDRPLPRPYPDRIVLSLDEQQFGFLTAGVCMIG